MLEIKSVKCYNALEAATKAVMPTASKFLSIGLIVPATIGTETAFKPCEAIRFDKLPVTVDMEHCVSVLTLPVGFKSSATEESKTSDKTKKYLCSDIIVNDYSENNPVLFKSVYFQYAIDEAGTVVPVVDADVKKLVAMFKDFMSTTVGKSIKWTSEMFSNYTEAYVSDDGKRGSASVYVRIPAELKNLAGEYNKGYMIFSASEFNKLSDESRKLKASNAGVSTDKVPEHALYDLVHNVMKLKGADTMNVNELLAAMAGKEFKVYAGTTFTQANSDKAVALYNAKHNTATDNSKKSTVPTSFNSVVRNHLK